jgi:hypothetical protein|tara:strand:+ start:3112 stop:3519 length:408 start_codon:yes stop_codon:yes gene_type:complete
MKKLALLIILSYSLQVISQTSDLIPVLYKETEEVCETGNYKKVISYIEGLGQKKEKFDQYILLKDSSNTNINYILPKVVKSDIDYYKEVTYAIENILHPNIHIEYQVRKKYTAVMQYHDSGKCVCLFIFGKSPRH